MLVYGAMLQCLDPVLTIAAAQGFGKPVFWSPLDKREEVSRGPVLSLRLPLPPVPLRAAPSFVCLCCGYGVVVVEGAAAGRPWTSGRR